MEDKPVNNSKDLGIWRRRRLRDRLNNLLIPLDPDMSVDIIEDYKGAEGTTVLRINKYGEPADIINITGNSNKAIFKEFCRYIANGEKCIGYEGEEK